MFERALPHWHTHGIDLEHGGFTERLTLNGAADPVAYKRIRVQARQIYVFSHASLIERDPARAAEWRAAAAQGFDFMSRKYWQGPARGWARTVTPAGELQDKAADSYDQAFVLFACAWYYLAAHEDRALETAGQTLDFLDRILACAEHGGYYEGLSSTGELLRGPPRRQNPHMHLLEALLALHRATGSDAFMERAGHIVELFRTRFFDAGARSLGEYFTPEWLPADGPPGQIVEPGHLFEWSWILHNYAARAGSAQAHNLAQMAYDSALASGMHLDRNLVYDEIDRGGSVLRASHRLWPQTEALKAHIAAAEHGASAGDRDFARSRIAPAIDAIFHNYLLPKTGIWNDQLDAAGKPVSTFVPATSLYHLFLAFAETLRFYEANKSEDY